jgi:methyl-accepting chemotaxis protein
MFANLKLRNRMLLGYSIPLALFIFLVIPVLTTARQVAETARQNKISMAAIKGGDEMNTSLSQMGYDERGYLIDQNQKHLIDYQQDLDNFKAAAKNVGDVVNNSEQKERLQQMIQLENQYEDLVTKIIELVKQNKKAEAINIYQSGKASSIFDKFDQLNADFTQKEQSIINTTREKTDANIRFLIAAVLGGAILGCTLAICTAFWISSDISRKIGQAVRAIATSSTDIATAVEQQERSASVQAASVSQTTTTMDELGASSQTSAEQAEAAATGATQVLALVDGNNYNADMFGQSSLRTKVGQITEQILRLSEQTQQIGSISTLVSQLANQTNLLALNAAVEAVRAGEHGKGFAVVAAEIRKLADESKKSAERINALVIDIQNASNSTVMVTDEGRKIVESVVAAVNNIAMNTQQISLTAKQQAIAIQQVVESMNSINTGAAQTASGITQTKVGTQKLTEVANNLKDVV